LDSAEAVPRPHLIWLLDRPVWWKHGSPKTSAWKSALGRLTSALAEIGADPGGMLNPMRVKNPLGIGNGWHVFDDVTWRLSELLGSLPEVAMPAITEPSGQELDETDDKGSQNLFRLVAAHTNRRARELHAEDPEKGLARLKEEVLEVYEVRMRLRHGPLTQRQIELIRRQSERIAAFGWALAGRGRPKTPEEERRRKGQRTPDQLKDSYLNGYVGRSHGGDMKRINNRKRLAEDLPLAIEACWENHDRKPIRVTYLQKYIDSSTIGLSKNWDLVMEICDQKNIPYYVPQNYYSLRAKSIEGRHRTLEHIKAVIKDEVAWVPWRGGAEPRARVCDNKPRRGASNQPWTGAWNERFVPRAKRKRIKLAGIPIGRPLAGIAELDALQACVDEILARQGGVTSRLADSWSGELLRQLNRRLVDLKGIAFPRPLLKAQALMLEAHKIMWARKQGKKHSLGKAIKSFPRVPQHMLLRSKQRRAYYKKNLTPAGAGENRHV
jgi:hypothetical protein